MCLGQPLLDHSAGFYFLQTSCLQLDSSGIYAVARLYQEISVDTPRHAFDSYSMVFSLSFDQVLRAKLAHPDLDVDKWPRKTDIEFPRRSAETEAKRIAWLEQRDEVKTSKVILPDGMVLRWSDWKSIRSARYSASEAFTPDQLHWLVGQERWRNRERAAGEGEQDSTSLVEAVDDELDGVEWTESDESDEVENYEDDESDEDL